MAADHGVRIDRGTSFNPSTSDDRYDGFDAFAWHNAYDRQGLTAGRAVVAEQSLQSEISSVGIDKNEMESFKSLSTKANVTYV